MKQRYVALGLGVLVLLMLLVSCSKTVVSEKQTVPVKGPLPAESPAPETQSQPTGGAVASTTQNTVEVTQAGFVPQTITISSGDKVTWINKYTVDSWPASALHPTHKMYPGSDINKCNTLQKNQIFDACQRLQQGESWSFTFNQKGMWKYHDHLNPSRTGTVVVE